MSIFREVACLAGALLCLTVGTSVAQTNAPRTGAESADHAKNIRFQDLK